MGEEMELREPTAALTRRHTTVDVCCYLEVLILMFS